MKAFTENSEITGLLEKIKSGGLDKKVYSDVIDKSGNQYVDLVQEGGGLLGIALVGYTYMLEKAGIRFFSLAGTSAGAINTIMIACLAKIGDPVSEKILKILSEKNLFDFVDGHSRIRRLIRRYVEKKPFLKLSAAFNANLIWQTLKNDLGLNPGDEFEKWVVKNIADAGIHNMEDLEKLRAQVPVLFDRESKSELQRIAGLKIIASEITTKSKITFPEMSELYWNSPGKVNPAKFVRASMSIPFFFNPFQVDGIPNAGAKEDVKLKKEETKWLKHTGYFGEIPSTARFVDGGMLSNFPINAFHRSAGVPKKPTFGARLSTWREEYSRTDKLDSMMGAMISTMRQLHDYDFLLRNPDYSQLICNIDADAKRDANGEVEFNWLDFNMPRDKQVKLFIHGARKAVAFLETFNWDRYKSVRKGLAEAEKNVIA
jgi:NTE family protein